MFQYLLLLETDREKEFFKKIYRRYRHEMYHIAYGIMLNRADAEDIVHETFLALLDNLDKIMDKPPQQVWNYIMTIIKNKCYNLCKKRKWETGNGLNGRERKEEDEIEMADRMVRMEQAELLQKQLKKMKSTYRDVLLLQYYHELTVMEIAEIMDTTPDNVRHMSMRAKRKLEKLLEETERLEGKA